MLCYFQRGPSRSLFLFFFWFLFFFFPYPPAIFLQSSVSGNNKGRDLGEEVHSTIPLPQVRSYSVHAISDRCLPNLLLKISSDGALTASLGNLLQCFAVPIIKTGFLISNLQLKATISSATHHHVEPVSQASPTEMAVLSFVDLPGHQRALGDVLSSASSPCAEFPSWMSPCR